MGKQVFQTDDKSRWNKFRWTLFVIGSVVALLLITFIIMLFIDKAPGIPYRQYYRKVLTAEKPLLKETRLSKEYKGFRNFIEEKEYHQDYEQAKQEASLRRLNREYESKRSVPERIGIRWQKFPSGIRSAFYVAWDPQSLSSLKRNIHNLNLVIPEWFFIDPKTDTVRFNIDTVGYRFMQKSGVMIMPMLSNNYEREFRSEGVGRILHDKQKREALIEKVLKECLNRNFVGINIDFEDLNESGDEPLIQFVKDLSKAFHANGLIVSQDIMPFNSDYNVRELAKYNDYLILMAYDEYSGSSDPGPICSQRWIESTVDDCTRKIPASKIILGLGAFGYDWPGATNGNQNLTYQQALAHAKTSKANVIFDNDTYNLHFSYKDETSDKVHQVYFTDAATTFNTLRFATESGLAGTAIWRLGSEDNRIWKFYNKNMTIDSIKSFDFKTFKTVRGDNDIDYMGDGEILNVLYTPHNGKIDLELDTASMIISEEKYIEIPSTYEVMKYGEAPQKELVLTFDDGPDDTYTPQILDILSEYHVPAAFFIVGLQAEKNLPLLKRIYKEGFEIGNHTFSHRNIALESADRAILELKLTRLLIESVTGHSTVLFRAPYNADSEPSTMEEIIPAALARQQNYLFVGENIDPEDWTVGIKADTIFARVVKAVNEGRGNVILLHDAGGETRRETVKALPMIIDYFQKKGYSFTSLSGLLHQDRNVLMPAIPKGANYEMMQMNLTLVSVIYWLGNFFTALFVLFIILSISRLIFMVVLMIRERKKEKKFDYDISGHKEYPLVSIIVPAYNEEVNAVSSVNNLLKQSYPNFDVIFVDDGSKDNTYALVSEAFKDNDKVKIYTHPNGGKASALDFGIEQTSAEYVVCIDADTKLYSNAVQLLITHFIAKNANPKLAAVAGNVKVGNQVNMLTKWQAIEYTTSQNFDRMAYANINAITVIPGAIGAFKASVLKEIGGFTTDTLAEDCDLTMWLLRAGYVIENENKAIAMTEAPEHIGQFVRQRSRWSFGVMQSFWKHRDTIFRKKYAGLGMWAIPNMLVFQFVIPFFSPLADILMIIGLFAGNAGRILIYYLIFTLVDASVSIAAFIFEKKNLSGLLWLIPQRFVYRWIMYIVLFKSLKKAIKGEMQTWGILKRTGNVAEVK